MNRRIALIALASFCLVIPACGLRADKRITKANFERIKPGMTRDEVDQILGKGDDDQGQEGLGSSAAAVGVSGGLDSIHTGTPALRWVRYGTDYTHIRVCFNRADKVHDTNFKEEKGLK